MLKENKFKFFSPISEIIKGKDASGNEEYRVKGVISDASEDSDGENITPEGLDFEDFAFINWDHRKEPKYIIGEPDKVKRLPNGATLMEGRIYPDSEVGQQAVQLMKILKGSKRGNKLAWSIEGTVLERDLINPQKVTKAKITAVALCPTPKNGNTWADLIEKGFNGETSYQEKDELEFDNPDGGDTVILDVTLENGDQMLVDREGNIEIKKCQDTTNSRALIKEDVEGNKKKLEKAIVVLVKAHKSGDLSDEAVIRKLQKYKSFTQK